MHRSKYLQKLQNLHTGTRKHSTCWIESPILSSVDVPSKFQEITLKRLINANRPIPRPTLSQVYLVGSGIASLASAVCLVQDAGMPATAPPLTTTASAIHNLPNGGRLIDTPGARDFVPAIPQPDCGIKHAVHDGISHTKGITFFSRRIAHNQSTHSLETNINKL